MSRFQARDLVVEAKQDGSPVTDADRAIELALRTRLEHSRPTHAVVGEEDGQSGQSEWLWYLDPVDGTNKFAVGASGWCTLIALAHGDQVVLGVASAPTLGRRWWALQGVGAFCNGQRLRVSPTARLADATVNDDWRQTLSREVSHRPLAKLAAACAQTRPHQGHSFLAIAGGLGDVGLGVGGHPWDYAPMKILVEEAGGRFTDLHGNDAIDSGHALVSNGLVHDEALCRLADSTRTVDRRM